MTVYFQAVQDVQISTRASRSQYQYTLTATDAAAVNEWSKKLVQEMRQDPLFRDVSSDGQEGGLRALVTVDRQRAGQLGVSVQAVNDTLNDAFAQRQISTIFGQANQYRVVLEALPEYQRDPSVLSKLAPRRRCRSRISRSSRQCHCRSISRRAKHSATRFNA
jgi:multidrug efflux pump